MKQSILNIIVGLLFSLTVLGQEKIYYDADWKVCNESSAEYYRLVSFDKNGKPKGKVKDYYLSSVLQWEGQLSYMDKYDNSKDLADGICTFYTKEGKKERTEFYENGKIIKPSISYYYHPDGSIGAKIRTKAGKREGESTWYYENGATNQVGFFKNNKKEGIYIWFNEKGEISSINEYKNDIPMDKFWISYDSYKEEFTKYFSDNFENTENPNGWFTGKDTNGRECNYSNGSIKYKFSSSGGHKNSVKLNLVNDRDYTISINLKRISGPAGEPFGLIWGLKDWDNYNYFYISSRGGFKIGAEIDGFDVTDGWNSNSSAFNSNSSNELRVKKIGDKIIFAMNAKMVHSKKDYSLSGSEVGFMVFGNGTEILMEDIEVTQEFTKGDYKKLISKYYDGNFEGDEITKTNPSNESAWKGNGTGFFIDKNGYLATNYHVIENANDIEVEFVKNGVKMNFIAKVIQTDKQNDLAIIKITDDSFVALNKLPYNFKTNISDVGSNVFALGYPMALTVMGTEIKFTDGKISSKTGYQGDITTYQTTTPIQPGNSGGPLFDYDGNLIAINSAILRPDVADNVSYSIKSNYLKNLIDVLDYKISLPNDRTIATKTLTEKIKTLSDYVVLIKVR